MPLSTSSIRNVASGVISEARAVKGFCQQAITQSAAGPVSANSVLGLCQRLNASKANILVPAQVNNAAMTSLAQDLGLADGPAAVAAVQDVVNSITNTIDWVVANFPKDAQGYIQKDTLNADGSVAVRQFTSAQTSGLRVALQTVVDSVS